jgi:hypothetical protein
MLPGQICLIQTFFPHLLSKLLSVDQGITVSLLLISVRIPR